MMPGQTYLYERAAETAKARLKQAARFAELNIKNPIFQKRLGKGAAAVLVRFEWPGLLTVLDPETGEVLAVSELGQPEDLSPHFDPPIPALANRGSTLPGAN